MKQIRSFLRPRALNGAARLAFAAVTLFALAGILRAAEVLDGVAAVVNGDVITFSQVREVVSARERALRAQ